MCNVNRIFLVSFLFITLFTSIESQAADSQIEAKAEVDKAEAKVSATKGASFDPEKLNMLKEVMMSQKDHPDLVAIRAKIANLMVKPAPTLEERNQISQLAESLWVKQRELVLAARPELKEFVAQREALNLEISASLARRKATPEVSRAIAAEIKAREEAAAKQKKQ